MLTIQQSLKSGSSYPTPQRVLDRIAAARGLDLSAVCEKDTYLTKEYQLAEADLLIWLSNAPNVSEGGVTFSFSADDKRSMKQTANSVYTLFDVAPKGTIFGYKGDSL